MTREEFENRDNTPEYKKAKELIDKIKASENHIKTLEDLLTHKYMFENATVSIEPYSSKINCTIEFDSDVLIESINTVIASEKKQLKELNDQLEVL